MITKTSLIPILHFLRLDRFLIRPSDSQLLVGLLVLGFLIAPLCRYGIARFFFSADVTWERVQMQLMWRFFFVVAGVILAAFIGLLG